MGPSSASTELSADAAAASVVPLKRLRVDLVDLRYAPLMRNAEGDVAVRHVLHGVTAAFAPFTVSALMGPSGSGKTSLLTVLAGFVDRAHVSGDILVNGEGGRPAPKKLVGIVFQDDMMLPALTVLETIKFAADLRMSPGASEAARHDACEAILTQLGLSHVRDSLVGGAARRGISGGERKRLSVGVELVTRPALLLMDEPTSGLDSSAALSLMRVLRALARRGQTIVASIHQPRTTVFDSFDNLVLLSKGHTLYHGVPGACVAHLERVGASFPLPPRTNPADWLMDVIAADEAMGEDERRLPGGWRMCTQDANASSMSSVAVDIVEDVEGEKEGGGLPRVASTETLMRLNEGATVWRQLYVLTVREGRCRRGANLTRINFLQTCLAVILTGLFWWQLPGDSDKYVMERFSILFFTIIAQSNAVVLTCVNTFARERQLMLREYAKGMYHPLPFFIAKTMSDTVNTLVLPSFYGTVTYWAVGLKPTAEAYFIFLAAFALCILVAQSLGLALSCAIPDVQVSLMVAPMITLMLMILGGFYVNFSSMPTFIRWLSWGSQARYAFTAMVINEFRGRKFTCVSGPHVRYGDSCPLTGEEVITALEMDSLTIGECFTALVLMQIMLRMGAYLALVFNFSRMKHWG